MPWSSGSPTCPAPPGGTRRSSSPTPASGPAPLEVYVAEDAAQSDLLVAARRVAVTAVEQLGVSLLDDVAVPRSRLPEAIARFEDVARRYDVLVCTFGHAGDGNLHPTVVHERGDADAAARAAQAFEAILDVALELGGTVTGEHGVGLLKRRSLGVELEPAVQSLHARGQAGLGPQRDPQPWEGSSAGTRRRETELMHHRWSVGVA